jgi:hypothetical protein
MEPPPASPEELDAAEAVIDRWLASLADHDAVLAIDRGEPGERRWYVRLRGEQKDYVTVWFSLGQRTLAYETYVMPAPEENVAAVYEYLLRRNLKLHGAAFAIGPEDALYLRGQLAVGHVDDDALDRILGSLYEYTEQSFRPAMRIGFASRFRG